MRKELFENNEIYHIYNRGTEKRNIFIYRNDFWRFFIILYLYNTTSDRIIDLRRIDVNEIKNSYKTDKKLVEILHWALMPNHFHLLLKQKTDGGISKFIQKVCTGYTMYFNIKYERSGRLFQGVFKSKHVPSDDYLFKLASYIPLNPLSLAFPQWPEKGIQKEKIEAAEKFMLNYEWSSFRDYFHTKTTLTLTNIESFIKIFGGSIEDYKNFLRNTLLIPNSIAEV